MIKIENNKISSDNRDIFIRYKGSFVIFKEATKCEGDTVGDFEEITEEQNQKDIEARLKTL